MTNGTVKILGRKGCPVGEVRSAIDGRCHKILHEHHGSYAFNIRDKKTNKILSSTIPVTRNMLSVALRDAQLRTKNGQNIMITVEKVIYDSKKNKPLTGRYVYRDKDMIKTGYIP